MCYDAVGNKLVEHKVIPKNMGYPVDVSLSEDGNTLLVSYIYTEGIEVTSKVSYYSFGDGNTTKDYQVYQKDFGHTVIPVTAFLKHDISLLVADNALIFYKGLQELEETARVELKTEIQSVAYNEELVAVMLRKDNATDYKLHIYNNTELITIHDISDKKINYKEEHYNEGFMNILKNKKKFVHQTSFYF